MLRRNIGNVTFYSLLTVIMVIALFSDYHDWKDKKIDIQNTLGSMPSLSSTVDEFEIKDSKGNIINSTSMSKKDYMIILWEIDDKDGYAKFFFDSLNEKIKGIALKDIDIIPVNIGDRKKDVENFFAKNNYSFPFYLDYKKKTKWAFNRTQKYPIVYILDSKGVVKFRQTVGVNLQNMRVFEKLSQQVPATSQVHIFTKLKIWNII